MNKRTIVKEVLKRLQEKKLLRESPEGDSNAFTSDIQTCLQEISSTKEYTEQLVSTTVDTDDQDLLSLIKNKLDYVTKTLTDIITKQTASTTEPMQEDVGMTTDQILKEPDTVKKLSDKNIEIDLKDDDNGIKTI